MEGQFVERRLSKVGKLQRRNASGTRTRGDGAICHTLAAHEREEQMALPEMRSHRKEQNDQISTKEVDAQLFRGRTEGEA